LNIDPGTSTDELTDEEINNIRKVIDGRCKVEGELRTEISMNIKPPYGSWLLPWSAPPQRITGTRPAHQHQRSNPQGAEAYCRQEKRCCFKEVIIHSISKG
jgi:hypothetical protein